MVQTSFEHVAPIADVAGMMFYGRLFELAPQARALFGDDIGLQARRTMGAIAAAVDGSRRRRELGAVPSCGSVRAMPATACSRSTSTSPARRCCGRSSEASGNGSRRRSRMRGRPRTDVIAEAMLAGMSQAARAEAKRREAYWCGADRARTGIEQPLLMPSVDECVSAEGVVGFAGVEARRREPNGGRDHRPT